MKVLIIIGCILFIILSLLSTRIKIKLDFAGKLRVELRYLVFHFRLYPKKLTPKRVIRAQKKQRKKVSRKAEISTGSVKGSAPQTGNAVQQKEKPSPMAVFRLVWHILRSVYRKFPGCFCLHLNRCVIVIAGKDAADTAIRYGAARSGVAWFCELLETAFTVKTTKKSVLSVDADFIGNESRIDLSVLLSARVFSLVDLLIRIFVAYLRRPLPLKKKKTKRKNVISPAKQT